MNWLRSLFTRPNPARELALRGHRQRREKIRAVTRQMREDMGLPPLEALR